MTACAREQSAEDRDREERDRVIERLKHAEGNFAGTVETADQGTIPFALTVNVNRNPEQKGDEPGLTAHVRLGLLGGVDLTTDAVTFDYGSGQLTASFSGGDGAKENAKTLELQAAVDDPGLKDARLIASSGKIFQVTAAASPTLNLAEPSVELIYGIRISPESGGDPVDAVLSLTRRTGDSAAPSSSDMPRMPQIEGSLRFPGAARVAHVASTILYDALTDTLDIYFPGGNGMRLGFTGLSTKTTGLPLTFVSEPKLSGIAELGSRTMGTVKLSPNQSKLIEKTRKTPLPSTNYTGTYKGSSGSSWPVVANAVYLGTEGTSGSEIPFNRFPKIRFVVSLCVSGQALQTKKLILTSVDYLTSEATFTPEAQPDVRYYATYGDSWSKVDTKIIDDRSGDGAGANTASLHLEAAGETSRLLTCADTRSAPETLARLLKVSPINKEFSLRDDHSDDPIDAPFLTYEGYLTRGSGSPVPIGISVFPRQNPGGGADEPSLQVTARVGFFGGANLASEPAVFNWGSGRISASFTRPNGAPLELRGILEPDTLRDAVMIGPNLGQSSLVVRSGIEPYASMDLEGVFNTAIAKGEGPVDVEHALQSVLTLRGRSEGATAPANIDLPVLPSIDASLRVDGLGQTPQVGSKVLYDVLRGTIEIYFSDSSVLQFTNVFLQPTGSATRPYQMFTSLTGRLILGGQPVAAVSAEDVTRGGRWVIQDLPYTIYIGTYQGGGSTQKLKALARVDYPGNAGSNTAEYPFQKFPNLQTTVTLCLGSNAFSRRDLELEAVDYLERRLVFKNRGTGARNALEVAFEPRWLKLTGEFRDTDGSSGDTQGSRLDLTALPNASNIDCSTPLPTQ
jgi:hypothetical protein